MEELCLFEFLFADMNTARDVVLPPNHSVVLWKNPEDAEVHGKSISLRRGNKLNPGGRLECVGNRTYLEGSPSSLGGRVICVEVASACGEVHLHWVHSLGE